jgi:DNA-binding IscR family transcriptional regulator
MRGISDENLVTAINQLKKEGKVVIFRGSQGGIRLARAKYSQDIDKSTLVDKLEA